MARRGIASRLRRPPGPAAVPAAVRLAVVAYAALLAAWAFLTPLYQAPDEWAHVDLVAHLADGGAQPGQEGRWLSLAVVDDCATYAATTRWCSRAGRPAGPATTRKLAADAPPWRGGPTYAQLGGDEQVGRRNQLLQHPPLYYRLQATVLRVERAVLPGTWSLAREVTLLRLTGVLLLAPLPLLAWAATRAVGASSRAGVVAALLPLTVPQLAHIGASVNNDALLILLGGVLALGTARLLGGDRSWRTVAVLAVAAPAALLTKSSAVFLLVPIPIALLVGWRRGPTRDDAGGSAPSDDAALPAGDGDLAGGVVVPTVETVATTGAVPLDGADAGPSTTTDGAAADRALGAWRPAAARLAAIGLSTLCLGGWWYVANKVRHGTFTPWPNAENYDGSRVPEGFTPSRSAWWERFATYLPARFWGSMASRTGNATVGPATLVALGLLAVGLLRRRRERPGRVDVALLLLPAALLLAFVAVRGWDLYTRSGTFPFLQGRYLFPGIVGGAVVAGLGADRLAGRWAAPAVAAGAVMMQAVFANAAIRTYWGRAADPFGTQLGALAAWSRLPAPLTLGVLGVAAAGLVALTARVALDACRPADGPAEVAS